MKWPRVPPPGCAETAGSDPTGAWDEIDAAGLAALGIDRFSCRGEIARRALQMARLFRKIEEPRRAFATPLLLADAPTQEGDRRAAHYMVRRARVYRLAATSGRPRTPDLPLRRISPWRRRQHTVVDLLQQDVEGRLALRHSSGTIPTHCRVHAIVEPVDLVDRHRHVATGPIDPTAGERHGGKIGPPGEKLGIHPASIEAHEPVLAEIQQEVRIGIMRKQAVAWPEIAAARPDFEIAVERLTAQSLQRVERARGKQVVVEEAPRLPAEAGG